MIRKFTPHLVAILFFTFFNQSYLSQNLYEMFDSKGRPLIQKGVITVKLKERLTQRLAKGANSFGVYSLDEKLSRYGATNISKRFNHKPIPEGSELPDLSRIYKIELPQNVDTNDTIIELSKDQMLNTLNLFPFLTHQKFLMIHSILYKVTFHKLKRKKRGIYIKVRTARTQLL